MLKHLLGIKWDPETPPYSFFWIRDFDNSTSKDYLIPVESGKKLNITIHKEKFCVGHKVNETEYQFCNRAIPDSYTQCYQCQLKDFSRCFVICDPLKGPESCPNKKAYEYCQRTPRSVYLALIGSEIKVGISFHPLKRWINQGADVAVEIWRAKNGLQAREIELLISSQLNISQTINTKNKIQEITRYNKRSLIRLKNVMRDVKQLLQATDYELIESSLLYKETHLAGYYGDIPKLNLTPIYINLSKNPHISGKVIGMKGSLLVTQVMNSYYVFNMKEAIAHIISIGTETLIQRQKSLFDFI